MTMFVLEKLAVLLTRLQTKPTHMHIIIHLQYTGQCMCLCVDNYSHTSGYERDNYCLCLTRKTLGVLCSDLTCSGVDPGGGLGGLQPPVLSPEPGKYHGKRAQSHAELPTILEIPGINRK